jgi:methionyl-tRNA formyltransferase
LRDEFALTVREFAPDLIVAACFPWRLPSVIRDEARLGGINLHPSLLPHFRGPDPLFWVYYFGEPRSGATVHQMSDDFDAGAILGQKAFDVADGLPGDRLEALAASYGADLLVDVIAQLGAGKSDPQPQDATLASNQSWPSHSHLIIRRDWSVRHTLNFVTGVIPLGYAPQVETSRGTLVIQRARQVAAGPEPLDESWSDAQTVRIAVADGAIEFMVE